MKTISIHVPPSIADLFEQADENKKRKAEIYINAWLSDFFNEKSANEKLLSIMKASTDEAKSKGFTPNMIDDLLKEDE